MGSEVEDMEEMQEVLAEIKSISEFTHITETGIHHESLQKVKASLTDHELSKIVHLVDSHVPSLRARAAMRYQRLASSIKNINEPQEELQLLKDIIVTKCNTNLYDAITELKRRISSLPKEWTIVQITKHYNPMEGQNADKNKYYTDGLYITLFNCGQTDNDPFVLTVDPPAVNGIKLELCQQLMDSLEAYNKLLMSTSKRAKFLNRKEKTAYRGYIEQTESTLKDIVVNIEKNWLRVWRCLFTGKFADQSIEQVIRNDITDILKKQINDTVKISQRSIELLYHITKGGYHLSLDEIITGVYYCLKDICTDDTIKNVAVQIKELSIRICKKYLESRKHPVILVVDEVLDSFPWERMEVLQCQSVSRVPSFHFVYFLYKVHEASIKDGYKIIENYENGKIIMNPDGDLETMASRMRSFYRYWLPKWDGIYNEKPSHEQFCDLLQSADIFAYNGHGNGTHIMVVETLQQIKLKAVVLLFGCASTRINRLGPQVGTYGSYHMFLISRCPCVLGMLWPVTDLHTDLFTAELLSSWIPSEASIPWSEVDKSNWMMGIASETNKQFTAKSKTASLKKNYILELPQALAQCKTKTEHYLTKAACIIRGIPVKIKLA